MIIQPAFAVCTRAFFRCVPTLFLWGGLVSSGFGWSSGAEGFRVDSTSRRDVLAFYHAVYGASEGFEARAEWTGNVAELSAGTTSQMLKNDVLRRVNFYRALAGLPADLTLNAEKSAKAQEAALLAARNGGLSHYPAREQPGWAGLNQLPLGVEASAKSNLSLGAYGPAAVDGQIRDDGDANWQVGHRRWLLSPRQAEIGTGDVPGQPGFSAANAVWVGGEFKSAAPVQFVPWPNRGYTPANLLPKRWSVSHAGADFSGASVRMSRDGTPVPVRVTSTSSTPADSVQGEQTLVWEPAGVPAEGAGDVAYSVQVTGIRIGGEPSSLSYNVVAFDPGVLGETLSLTGAGSVTPAGGAYAFSGIAQADSYELTVARGSAAAWMEGAEGAAAQILANTAPGYAVVQSQVAGSGTRAFHLTHPGTGGAGFADQLFQLKRRLVPGPDTVLQFSETGRFAETTTTLSAEVSADDGLTWTAVWSRLGVGLSSALFDAGWNPHAVSLRAYSGRAVLVRFCLKSNGGPVAAGTTKDYGFFVDNITVTNAVELVDARVTTLAGTASGFELDRTTAGSDLLEGSTYYVSVAPRVGTRLFPSGPLKVVSVPVVSAMAAAAAAAPVITVQPLEGRVAAGFSAVFSVGVAGGGEFRYQWRKNGVAIEGGTSAAYRIDSAQGRDAIEVSSGGGYDVVVTGGGESVTSERVGLTVVEGGAYIIENPAGSSVKLGGSYTMRVTSADTDLLYQWRKNGVAIAGATGASYTLSAIKATDAGRYDVVLRNGFGEVVSSPAYVGVASRVAPNFQTALYQWTTLAGNGLPGDANGTGLAAQFNTPCAIALHAGGTLYVSDTGNQVIRKVTQAGVVTTVAGASGTSGSADGAALSVARFDSPQGIAVDTAGAVYIADSGNNTVRKLTNPGQISATVNTVAGVAGQFGASGALNSPLKVAVDPSGRLYVLDNSTIRKVESKTQFTLLFGELLEDYTGTRPVPTAMAVDSTGKVFAAASEGGEFKVFSRIAGGTFAATHYGPYAFPVTDLALGAGTNLYAATQSTVELLGDASETVPGAGLPVNLTNPLKGYAAPIGLTVDAEGTVYAVDPFLNTVIKGVAVGLPVFVLQPVGATGKADEPMTLSAFATGAGTVGYQWYRDGVAIAGATGASFTMDSGGAGVGEYVVEASNTAGKVSSAPAKVLGVTVPLEIVGQPQALTVVEGSAALLEVGWRGPVSTTFQWYRNGVALSGATSAVCRFASVKGTDAGDYKVELRSGTVSKTSAVVKLSVSAARFISILQTPPMEITVLKGGVAGVKFALDPNPPGTVRTTYKLFTYVNNALGVDTKIGGTVSASGELEVPLKGLKESGSYAVLFSRHYADKGVSSAVTTPPFDVRLRTFERAVGTYELLLGDANGLVGDGASYRGVLLATVTMTGAVSGRILYNEALPFSGAGGSQRAYAAVVRTFSTAFTVAATDANKVVCAPKLGVGAQANRQALELELDFSGTAVALNALVRDRISVAPEVDQEGCVSRGGGAVRVATKLTQAAVGGVNVDLSSLVGRYVLGSDFALAQGSGLGQSNNATLLAEVLPTGKVVWASRLSGFAGSGAATLSTTDPAEARAQVYEGRTLSSASALSTNSLLGQLLFKRLTNGTLWSAGVSSSSGAGKLERQSCHISKANKVPVYVSTRFDLGSVGSPSFNWSGVQSLDFQNGTSHRWTGSTTAGLLEFLKPAATAPAAPIPPLYLTAEDPAGGGTYVWTVSVSSAGAVKATNYSATSVQPALTLRLDKTRGAWTGSYAVSKAKVNRALAGVLVRPSDGGSLRGAGWVEVGAVPSTRTGGWRLDLTAPVP